MTATTAPSPPPASAAGAATDTAGADRRRRRRRERATVVFFLVPALALFGLLVMVPIAVAVYTSLFRWGGFGMPSDFRGLGNFTQLFSDPVFLGDLSRGGVLIGLSLALQLPFALGVSVLLNQRLRGRAVYRVVFFAPYVLSEVITGVLFSMVFEPGQGPADRILHDLGLGSLAGHWFADTSTVLPTLFVVMTWKYFGFHMMLYLAGMQGIPAELGEAALIDGAGPWQRFRYVTLPLLGPTIRISIFLSVIGAIQLFDLVWVTTNGGPVHASETMAVTMFQFGFKRYQVGYASAISVVMFLISMVFAVVYQRYVMRRDTEGAVTTMRGAR